MPNTIQVHSRSIFFVDESAQEKPISDGQFNRDVRDLTGEGSDRLPPDLTSLLSQPQSKLPKEVLGQGDGPNKVTYTLPEQFVVTDKGQFVSCETKKKRKDVSNKQISMMFKFGVQRKSSKHKQMKTASKVVESRQFKEKLYSRERSTL